MKRFEWKPAMDELLGFVPLQRHIKCCGPFNWTFTFTLTLSVILTFLQVAKHLFSKTKTTKCSPFLIFLPIRVPRRIPDWKYELWSHLGLLISCNGKTYCQIWTPLKICGLHVALKLTLWYIQSVITRCVRDAPVSFFWQQRFPKLRYFTPLRPIRTRNFRCLLWEGNIWKRGYEQETSVWNDSGGKFISIVLLTFDLNGNPSTPVCFLEVHYRFISRMKLVIGSQMDWRLASPDSSFVINWKRAELRSDLQALRTVRNLTRTEGRTPLWSTLSLNIRQAVVLLFRQIMYCWQN
jgi:hypothetical protein